MDQKAHVGTLKGKTPVHILVRQPRIVDESCRNAGSMCHLAIIELAALSLQRKVLQWAWLVAIGRKLGQQTRALKSRKTCRQCHGRAVLPRVSEAFRPVVLGRHTDVRFESTGDKLSTTSRF